MARPVFLTRGEIESWRPYSAFPPAGGHAQPLIDRLKMAGLWHGRQVAGKMFAIACVALEITQRCNLDCALCYLSPNSEAVRDVPLGEIFRRIETIRRHYGPNTEVQVTGGDPTLRKREELIAIVRRIRELGLRPSLFTNGIRATRGLLRELAANGLFDVAFHVDTTQRRRGFATEAALNELRAEYIGRARGLGLRVIFNTTVCAQNFSQLPGVVAFLRQHAGVVSIASFQLQADTGRGELGQRAGFIGLQSVARQISAGAGIGLNFDATVVGHPQCSRHALCLEANGKLFNMLDAAPFSERLLQAPGRYDFDRRRGEPAWKFLRELLAHPADWAPALAYLGRLLWRMKADLFKARGRVHKLSFFIHNFMDAAELEAERCHACVFMVASPDGPISMCVHNAKRDDFILKPIRLDSGRRAGWWDPLTGDTLDEPPAAGAPAAPARKAG